jgi:hypothetical protein
LSELGDRPGRLLYLSVDPAWDGRDFISPMEDTRKVKMNAVWEAKQLWLWRHLAHPLAWSLKKMVVRRQWVFALLQRLSPNFLALALSLGELSRNTFIWWTDGGASDLVEENQTITCQYSAYSTLLTSEY